MTRKKNTGGSRAVAKHQPPALPGARRMNGGDLPVQVDAVYHVRDVHPSNDGPWSREADKIAWTDQMSGYACIIRRSAQGGHLGGYVAVPPTHPLYGMQPYAFAGLGIGVHGGISYADECQRREHETRSICHVAVEPPRADRDPLYSNAAAERGDDAWWFGFECDQPGDVMPVFGYRNGRNGTLEGVNERTYKTEQFVYEECVRLATQLKAVEEGRDAREADPGSQTTYYDPREIGR